MTGAKKTAKRRIIRAEKAAKKRVDGAKKTAKKRTTGAEKSTTKRVAGAKKTAKKRATGAKKSTTKRVAATKRKATGAKKTAKNGLPVPRRPPRSGANHLARLRGAGRLSGGAPGVGSRTTTGLIPRGAPAIPSPSRSSCPRQRRCRQTGCSTPSWARCSRRPSACRRNGRRPAVRGIVGWPRPAAEPGALVGPDTR